MNLRLHALGPSQYIEYAEFGDPQGKPAVFFHGFVGSIHQAAAAHAAALKVGLRIIAPHRPGIGRSTPVEGKTIKDAVQPALALLKHLKIEKYAAIGVSGGAPYAMACGVLDAARVTSLSLVSPLGPLWSRTIRWKIAFKLRCLLVVGAMGIFGRRLIGRLFSYKHSVFAKNLRASVLKFVGQVSPADNEVFRKNVGGALDMFVADHRVVMKTPESTYNLGREIQRYWHWGFNMRSVPKTVPCRIWHGKNDTMVPLSSAEYLRDCAPQADLKLLPGGHFASLASLTDIVGFAAKA